MYEHVNNNSENITEKKNNVENQNETESEMMKIKNSIEYFKKLTSVADCRRCE
jgi:galactokinase/mevalonate kinase-like predicted kinase